MVRINTFRALSYVFASQVVRLTGWAVLIVAATVLVAIFLLAHYFSDWWFVLLVPYIACLLIVIFAYIFAQVVLRTLYPRRLSPSQRRSLTAFNDKIIHLLEARAIAPWMIGAIVIKDLVLHRELTTLRELLNDSRSLKDDFTKLEKELDDKR